MKTDIIADNIRQLNTTLTQVMNEARTLIETQLEERGPFSHNIVGITLAGVADKVGTKYANLLVDQYNLTAELGIEPEGD